MALTYRDAGVDRNASARFIERLRPLAAATRRPEVLADVGGFAALCRPPAGMRDPVLVAAADGVGTKLAVARAVGRHDTVGIDLVAMCADDVATCGAAPLFFLDYLAFGRLDVEIATAVAAGIAEGCRQAGCALVGGETAEMPGTLADGYELAGFCVGVVERDAILGPERVRVDDRLVGLGSSGLHANGYALARRALLEPGLDPPLGLAARPPELGGASVGEVLLEPTRIYAPLLAGLGRAVELHALAHVTGGGLVENVPRALPPGCHARLRAAAWPVPPIFRLLERRGVAPDEMRRTFNLGLGMIAVLPAADVTAAIDACAGAGVEAWEVGEVRPGGGPLELA